ncbi:MAG TPA: glycoside hydrolase family 88 protein [Rhizomicrobium sp.]|nr:glycoside hydrolase family 88 protein [Rhizomicrobium sp.]
MRFGLVMLGFLIAAPAIAAPEPHQILTLAQHVADWQLAHPNAQDSRFETNDPRGWVQGAFYAGLTALANVSPDPNYAQIIMQQGARENWQLGSREFHADDQVIGQTWIWAYEHVRDPKMIAPVRARFDAVIAAAPHGSLDFIEGFPGMEASCQDRWCWCDALFMGPPGWVELSRATGDPKYLDYADKEYSATVVKLFDRDEHLFYRDSRFLTRKGPNGERIFWSRGNGWVYAGLARIISFLPAGAPERGSYVDLFRKMSERLVPLQKSDGYWPVSLLAPPQDTPPETSGTGFFTFGLAYGVASGILTDPKYRTAAERGWAALTRAVEPDGKLDWVQQIGSAPDRVHREDTQLYGVGALLLAGAAMIDMEEPHPAVTLKLHNPKSLERTAARIEIPAAMLPPGVNGDWVAVLDAQVVPLELVKSGAVTVLDLPREAVIAVTLRPRFGFDPPPQAFARATIPVKDGQAYRDVQSFTVPPSHVIHDPLFPIEGAGWESDRVGYRVYLDKRNAVDVYGKKLPDPVLDRIGQAGQPSYHDEAAWGMDIWHVGDSLGAGGLGVLRAGMATQIGDMKIMTALVAARGPVLAGLHVDCDGWLMNGKPETISADYTIGAGSRLSLNSAAAPGVPLVAGFGKYPDTDFFASPKASRGWGYMASWGRQSENGKDDVGVALFYPVAEIARTGDDGRSYYVVFKHPARARYAFAAAWSKEGHGLPDEASFRAWVTRTAAELSNPVTVTK